MPSSFDRRNQPPYLRLLQAIRRRWQTARTTEIFVGSFALMILLGAIGFKAIPGLCTGEPLTWTDAIFTATSAVCVTGLGVVDTATYFTFEGQLFLLVLVQVGGIGMLSLATMLIAALGGRPSLRSEAAAVVVHPSLGEITPRQLVGSVVKLTLFFETVGALALYLVWGPRLGWQEAVWPAIFHSVCAFCNAGFSTNSDSLVQFADSPATLLIISGLVIIGGLGFIVVEELMLYARRPKKKRQAVSLHTKLVVATTLVITVGSTALFLVFEWNEGLYGLSYVDRVTNALFLSITPRTAGFNTVDYTTMTDSTNFLTILLMMIGGSPGSTAGGIKTTSFAILGLLAWSRLRGRRAVTFANRSIPEETVQRAVGLLVGCGAIIIVGIFLLAGFGDFFSQDDPFLSELFEVTSAFNTVGLSMNVTPHLSQQACWVLILLMFIGRVGPLSFAAVLRTQFAQRGDFRYAHEDVVVG
ncbi:TrkH family potassium uptake protein [Aeoliella sp. SH292]|uniref:TrkH family potassium uptake protein n=1 Tax=Aeoliella sp. SH292 TaxID=3454464 RepID=UPI003F9BF3CC